ncbi:hypothetical protein PYW08_012317 [Mythimna loreyi]|uniref:Uncharacterized protein n=1 Tax=Mythimna loreyi TaxID=667449 RepID=A0ACC2Q021_9NEOP|nr:hypothetical protein PYW08_012317 [Mythimna loreyi]
MDETENKKLNEDEGSDATSESGFRACTRKAPQGKHQHGQSQLEHTSAENQDLKLVQKEQGASQQQLTVREDKVLDAPPAASQTTLASSLQNLTLLTAAAVAGATPKQCASERANLRTVSEPGNSVPEKAEPLPDLNKGEAAANVNERRFRRTLAELDPDVLLEVATAKARLLSPDTPPENILKEAMSEIFAKGTSAKPIQSQKRWWRQMYVEAEFILEVAIVKSFLPNKSAETYIREAINDQCTEKMPWFLRPRKTRPCRESARPCRENARPCPGNAPPCPEKAPPCPEKAPPCPGKVPPCPKSDRSQPPWWSQELETLRDQNTAARRRYTRFRRRRTRPPDAEAIEAELLKEYKAARAIYKSELKRAKELALEK